MTVNFIWNLPPAGDGRYGEAAARRRGERVDSHSLPLSPGVTDPRGDRFNYFDYLHQIARAAELSGFDAALIPNETDGDDSWIVAGYVARGTRRLKLIAGFEASWGSSVYAAKNASSFQRFTGGRLDWFLTEGGSAQERLRGADPVPSEEALPRLQEFVEVARGVLTRAPFSFEGKFFQVKDGGFRDGLDGQRVPTVYFSGEGIDARTFSARHADVHVFSPAADRDLQHSISALRYLAQEHGRSLRFGLRLQVVARETEDEATRDARLLKTQLGEAGLASYAHALVGSYDHVVERLAHYRDLGLDTLVLGAAPHLEEAYRLGTHVLPHFKRISTPTGTSNRSTSRHDVAGDSP